MFTIRFGISLDSDSKMIPPAYDDTENAKEEKRKIKAQIHPPKTWPSSKSYQRSSCFSLNFFQFQGIFLVNVKMCRRKIAILHIFLGLFCAFF